MLSFPPSALRPPAMSNAEKLQMPYSSAGDQDKHMNLIERLAVELGSTVLDVAPLYEEVLLGMRSKAQVQDYLPILVSKRVKQLLRR